MKNKFWTVVVSFCTLCCLTGCGERGSVVDPALNSATGSGTNSEDLEILEETDIDRSDFDWRQSEWKKTDAGGDGGTLYVGEYVEGLLYEADFDYEALTYGGYLNYGSFFYVMECFIMEDGEFRYYMNRYDGDTGEIAHTELDTDILLGGEDNAEISYFDICSEAEYVFFRKTYEEGHVFSGVYDDEHPVCGMSAVHMDPEGNIIKTVDLYQGIAGSNFARDKGWDRFWSPKVDRQGNYYIYSSVYDMSRKLLVLDSDGREACIIDPYPEATEGYDAIHYLMKNPDGAPVFSLACPGGAETVVFMYDQQEKGMKQMLLLSSHELFDIASCMTEDGMCYYLSSDGNLYRWDLYTGGSLKLMNYAAEDITTNTGMLRLTMNSEDRLLIYEDDDVPAIYVLVSEEPSAGESIRIVSLDPGCTELRASAADYTRKHRESGITVEYDSENPEAYRDRLMADLVAGKGPEAMYVSREDMETLYEKGLLEDLTEVLTPETAEQIFPGVLECGRIEGRQIGFAPEAELQTMLVNQDVWNRDSWSLEDVIALLEEEENRSNLEAVVATCMGPFGASGIFQRLVLWDMVHSPFMDLEKNTCSFDSEEFIRILELCKQYGKVSVGEGAVSLMHEGKALAYVDDMSDIIRFCQSMSELGENFHCVGYPTESGRGSFWECDYFLVVRKDADCMDTVKGYVEYLYSMRRQRQQDAPLNREVYARYITTLNDNHLDYIYLSRGQGRFTALKLKPDGNSSVEDFMELAEKSIPRPHSDDSIAEIVLEEVESFFYGDKDAATVAGIIQNRVKLYLAENS